MDYFIFSIGILVVLFVFFILGYFERRKQEAYWKRKWEADFGLPPAFPYKLGQMEAIARFFEVRKEATANSGAEHETLDDITWNDLEMDAVFQRINYALSSAGEEVLYAMLRTPKQKKEELEALEEKVAFFSKPETKRSEIRLLFQRLGRTGSYSLADYVTYLDTLGERSNKKHYAMNALMLLLIAGIAVAPTYAVIALSGSVLLNVWMYLKEKKEIEPYLISFSYVLRLLQSAKEMDRYKDQAVLAQTCKSLAVYQEQLKAFRKHSYLAMTSMANMGGNPFELVLDYARMLFHLDLIKFNQMLKEIRKYRVEVLDMEEILGTIEASISIAYFRASLPENCIPEFNKSMDEEMLFQETYHPLLKDAVKNSITVKKGILLTGSNASGKSTFLKTIAVNALLAQTIYTVPAQRVKLPFCRIYSSMALRDSMKDGESYYMVEIKALKRILDAAQKSEVPLLCFIDEVLRGTNTVERIAASTQILRMLSKSYICCFAATHDLELAQLLGDIYENYHFEEQLIDGDVTFAYQLLEGKSTTKNAILLLKVLGYGETMVEEASALAEHFVKTGTWAGSF